ncbi:4Fe-4S binding protein [bacterium]|nr:4Fe-4S binding protein [bacterium]
MNNDRVKNKNRRKIQLIVWWLLPIIIFGGIILPYTGYLVLGMMLSFLVLSVFKGRYWCGWLCPRGSFLETILVHISRKGKIPSFFKNIRFRWIVFFVMMSFMVLRLIQTGGAPEKIGFVFVTMCIITTVIAIPLGIIFKPRIWCVFCPMGTLQGLLGKDKNLLHISKDCTQCGICNKVCPIETSPSLFKNVGKVKSIDCLKCRDCKTNCLKEALTFK